MVNTDSGLRVIVTTAPPDQAAVIARSLLEGRWIGCANLLPGARSLYWWDGAIADEVEVVLVMECQAERVEAVVAELVRVHPYDVPKVLTLAPDSVNPGYLAWLRGVTSID